MTDGMRTTNVDSIGDVNYCERTGDVFKQKFVIEVESMKHRIRLHMDLIDLARMTESIWQAFRRLEKHITHYRDRMLTAPDETS